VRADANFTGAVAFSFAAGAAAYVCATARIMGGVIAQNSAGDVYA
jgi:hypothetical protein